LPSSATFSEPRYGGFVTLLERLELARKDLGLSQSKFSLRCGWDRSQYASLVSRLRRGTARELRATTAEAIEAGVGVSRAWLLFGTSPMYLDGRPDAVPPAVPVENELEHVRDPMGPGRWRRYAERYWTFRAEATVALRLGVSEDALDAASDRLGGEHGDGPTEEQARKTISIYARRMGDVPVDGREATDEDFATVSADHPRPKRAKR
jgi:hypothetical protein